MQVFACTDNGIHGARWEALGTADTDALINDRHTGWAFAAIAWVDRFVGSPQELSQRPCSDFAAGRALIGIGLAGGDGSGVG